MGKLFLCMAMGAAIMLVLTDDSKDGLRAGVRNAALAVAEAVHK